MSKAGRRVIRFGSCVRAFVHVGMVVWVYSWVHWERGKVGDLSRYWTSCVEWRIEIALVFDGGRGRNECESRDIFVVVG